MKASSVLVFSCFVFLVSCSVQFQDIPIDHSWEVMGRVDGAEELTVRFALKQQNLDILNDLFWKISDPRSEMFRKYLTREQAMELVSPPQEVQDLVVNWALENGCNSAQSFGDWVSIRANASVFEQLLGNVEINWVKDLLSGEISAKIPTSSYTLPSHIASVVDFVQNIAMFTHKHKISSRNPVPRNPVPGKSNEFFTPASEDLVVPGTIYNLYNISQSLVIRTNSSQNVVEFSATAYQPSDLTEFNTGTGVQTPNNVTIVGSFIPAPPDTECTLDIEMITAVGRNGTNFFWTTSGWLLDFTEELLTYSHPPLVNSISWATDERSEGTSYNFRCDTGFQLLGTMGISILAASGDEGAVGTSSCTGNIHEFNPAYPATSPFVTSVGATMLVGDPTTSTTIAPICDKYTCAATGTQDPADENLGGYATGGGFSVYETRPSYQNTVVTAYLDDSSIPKPPSQYFNSSNRGFPDVAAIGYQILIYINDKWESVGGTSAAAPCWGGVFALANDLLLKNGKKPLGFANPFLYQMYADAPNTFNNIGDLTTNNDDGCRYGYTSNPNGWDPVTGLGTPNVGNLLSYIQENLASLP